MMPAAFRPVGVKICGLNEPDAFDAAVAFGADWIGFNFFPPSPRFVTPAQAANLSARARGGPSRVGLFVDPTDAALAEALGEISLDALQIYSPPDRASEIRRRFGRDVWHAVGVASAADLPRAADGFDGFIIESKPPKGATRPGGNALAIDWALTAGWVAPKPWLLAGGLTPENVVGAIRASGATAVDVSSGVERGPGIKDPERIRAFIQAARAA
jgi:phosphoribosylanthranilate isomerase